VSDGWASRTVLYEIGLTRGEPGGEDLWAECFHDVADGVRNSSTGKNANGCHDAIPGEFVLTTGDDDLREDSELSFSILTPSGIEGTRHVLKAKGETGFGDDTEHRKKFVFPSGFHR
jgi:hypothetical protein